MIERPLNVTSMGHHVEGEMRNSRRGPIQKTGDGEKGAIMSNESGEEELICF